MSDTKSTVVHFRLASEIKEKFQNNVSRGETEHPYEFIHRAYSSTKNAKLTGLPGYTPPWYVKIINGLTYIGAYIASISLFQFIAVLGIVGVAKSIEAISNIVFTVSVPFMGWTVTTLPLEPARQESIVIVMTPLLASFLLFISSIFLFGVLEKISIRLSLPYEKEYEEWLESIEPSGVFPPSVTYALNKDEYDFSTVPTAAPTEFREKRLDERTIERFNKFKITLYSLLFSTILVHNTILFTQFVNGEYMQEVMNRINRSS